MAASRPITIITTSSSMRVKPASWRVRLSWPFTAAPLLCSSRKLLLVCVIGLGQIQLDDASEGRSAELRPPPPRPKGDSPEAEVALRLNAVFRSALLRNQDTRVTRGAEA